MAGKFEILEIIGRNWQIVRFFVYDSSESLLEFVDIVNLFQLDERLQDVLQCLQVLPACKKSDRTTDVPETKRSLHTQGPKTKNLLEGSQNDEKDRKALL